MTQLRGRAPGGDGPGGDDLALALELADAADEMTSAAFRRADLAVDTKPDLTPVTEADRQVERALRAALAGHRPDDAVVGEEFGASGTSRRRWIVDPIDGTKNFVRGIPVWATLLALEVDGALTVGVVSAPFLGRRWWAKRGAGAFAGPAGPGHRRSGAQGGEAGTPIHVSAVGDLADAHLSYSSLSGWPAPAGAGAVLELAARCWRSRAFGDFWSHVLVAEGACEVGLDPEASIWDMAAVEVIVEEAGGLFTDLSGAKRPDGGSGVSSNGLVHDAVLAALRR